MKRTKDIKSGKKLSHNKNNKYAKFQTDQTNYRSTTPVCMFTISECHYYEMVMTTAKVKHPGTWNLVRKELNMNVISPEI